MKNTPRKIFGCFLALFILSACALPALPLGGKPAGEEGTPNATLTALFDVNQVVEATITPPVVVSSTAALPTIAQVTATSTFTPEPTYTATVTATETATVGPSAMNTIAPTAIPSQRGNAQLISMYLYTPPTQDGTYAEWVDKTFKYTMPNFAWGKANWTNHSDLEGAFATGWDQNNLYVAFKITDDIYDQDDKGGSIYFGDSVEVLIDSDLLGDFYTSSLNSDDYQLGISAGNPSLGIAPSAYLFYPSGIKGSRTDKVAISYQFESATVYRIEAAIPWSVFGVSPYNGQRLGFAVNVDDSDNAPDYNHVTMLSSAAGLSVFNPTTWGELVLIK